MLSALERARVHHALTEHVAGVATTRYARSRPRWAYSPARTPLVCSREVRLRRCHHDTWVESRNSAGRTRASETKRYMHHYNSTALHGRGPRLVCRQTRDRPWGWLNVNFCRDPSEESSPTLFGWSLCTQFERGAIVGERCGSTLSLMDAGVPIKAPVAASRWCDHGRMTRMF
jgi:hypothetical protein